MRGYLTGEEKDLTSTVATIVHEIIHINQISHKTERQEANETNSSTKEERLARATEGRVKDRIVLSDEKLSKEEFDAYQEELKIINDKKGRKQQTVEEATVEVEKVAVEDKEYDWDLYKDTAKNNPELIEQIYTEYNAIKIGEYLAETIGCSPEQGKDLGKFAQYCEANGYSIEDMLGGPAKEAYNYGKSMSNSSKPKLTIAEYIEKNRDNLSVEEIKRLTKWSGAKNIKETAYDVVQVAGALLGFLGGNAETDIADYNTGKTVEKLADSVDTVKDIEKASDSIDINSIEQQGLKTNIQLFGGKTLESTSESVRWTNHGFKHFAPKNMSWKNIVKSTQNGPAKYLPDTDIEILERMVWEKGTKVTNGKKWKVMEFDDVIGAATGKDTKYMRVEFSSDTIHGHPITQSEYKKLLK